MSRPARKSAPRYGRPTDDAECGRARFAQVVGSRGFSQYGECHGAALDSLVAKGFAQVHGAGEHQAGFIAQDHSGNRGIKYRAVSLTEAGRSAYDAVTLL